MATNLTREFLENHFRKHETITLYKPDGTPVTFRRQYNIVMDGGYHRYTFDNVERMAEICNKQCFSTHPVISID